jgi:hypothetical protein
MARLAIPMVVVELPSFTRAAKGLLGEERISEIVTEIAYDPEAGDLMEGTGGVRKLRFGLDGRGKRGGVRVIYLFHSLEMPTYLITVFAKNVEPNLSKAELNAMGQLVEQIVAHWKERQARARGS